MRPPLILTSPDNPRLKRLLQLRKQRERRAENVFVAEGWREISRALAAGLRLHELFWSPEMTGQALTDLPRLLPGLERQDAALFQITPALVRKVSNLENPEGALAVFDQPVWTLEDIPPNTDRLDLFLVAVGINKPGNLGAMARTTSAAGAAALLAADAVVDAFNPNALRAATGAMFRLPVLAAATADLLTFLRRRAARILAATPDAADAYTDADLTGPVALVIGAEDSGVPPQWLDAADGRITIPMHTQVVDSLNASNAAAILLFECLRQRRAATRHP